MNLTLQAVIESVLAAILAGTVLVWTYNRYLATLRESYLKKTMSLAVLPLSATAGVAHGVAVWRGWPHLSAIAWVGIVPAAFAVRGWLKERRLNGVLKRRPLPRRGPRINFPKYPAPVRAILHALAPINGTADLELVQHTVRVPGLHPDMEGYRLLFLTDFHIHPTLAPEYFAESVRLGLARRPDAVIVGGDFVSRRKWRQLAAEILAPLARHPRVVAVRGNHDFWTAPRFFGDMVKGWGAELLTNRVTLLRRGDGAVALVGLEHPYIPLTKRRAREIAAELEQLDRDHGPLPRLGLVHTPEAYGEVERLGCTFALAGHSHGGQIRLPIFGTTIAACSAPRDRTYGRGFCGKMETITSNGIGAFFPLRISCPPQVVEVRLTGEG